LTKFRGHLDRLQENLEVLDEQIATAREMSKPKGKAEKAVALQWTKTLRDLVELRDRTLSNIKAHLLGRSEVGTPQEPQDCWEKNSEVEYERLFHNMLSPWHESDLNLKCEGCGVESEDVTSRRFPEEREGWKVVREAEDVDLCDKCYGKRLTAAAENESTGVSPEKRE
jgi:hypothetical protein